MKNVNQKIKNSVNVNLLVNNNNIHKRMVHYLLVVFFVLALFYVLILMNMVWNITARKAIQSNTRDLSNEVGNLELKYRALANNVDKEMSTKMGYLEIKPSFAKPSSLGSVALVPNEI